MATQRIITTVAALMTTGAAFGQEYFGLQHTPTGSADLVMGTGGLEIRNLGATGLDGFEVTLPPIDDIKRVSWYGDLVGLSNPAGDVGVRLGCMSVGPAGIPEEQCSMRYDIVSGVPTVSFDFSGVQPASVRVIYSAHGTVLLEEVLPAPFAGPFVVSADPIAPDPLYHNGFSAHFDWTCHCYSFDWTWDTSRLATLGGGELLGCDHIEVVAEGALGGGSSLSGVSVSFDGVSEVTMRNELVVTEPDTCECDVAGSPGGGADGVTDALDILAFLSCWFPASDGACP